MMRVFYTGEVSSGSQIDNRVIMRLQCTEHCQALQNYLIHNLIITLLRGSKFFRNYIKKYR